MNDIIVAIITSVLPTVTVLICSKEQKRLNKKHAAKQSILQLIMEDQVNYWHNGLLPVNYISIHEEYDEYHENGGNHYITGKVEAYDKWLKEITNERKNYGKSKRVSKRK